MADDYIGRALDEVSGSTVHRRREVLSSMFNRAVAEKLIDENPFRSTRVPQWAMNEAREREPFEPREIQRILAELPGEWPDMVAVCLLLGGLRLSDVATLKWEKIDFERGLVQVKDQKNNKPRRKPLIKPLRNIFERRRKVGGEWSPYVFPYAQTRYAEAGDKTSKLSIEFGKLLQEHKIVSPPLEDDRRAGTDRHFQPKTFHSLRTTSTTFLLDVGCPPELVRHIIGHDDPAIERAHYYKPTSETQQNYIEKLAELLNLDDV
jgi:integrase